MNPRHEHRCPDCWRAWDCRSASCRSFVERCDDCQPTKPRVEREFLTDQRGAVPGCYRRLPAGGAE